MRERTDSLLDRAMSDFLTAHSGLDHGRRERFAELIRSLLGALRDGHNCIAVDGADQTVLAASPLVSDGEPAPLVLADNRLYLHRSYTYETRLAEDLQALAAQSTAIDGVDRLLDRCFPSAGGQPDWQREAARLALSRRLAIIAGGPGTGKTTTVVRIVGLLLAHYGPTLKIALAAPTGKAAVRLQEALQEHLPALPLSAEIKQAFPATAQTLHRLLGVRRFSPTFLHTRDKPLPWDVVLVDEASMVDLALMCKLVAALRPRSQLILVGDKDQLASVEAGAVLSDCIRALPELVVELRKSWRFDHHISSFAVAVNNGDADAAWKIMTAAGSSVALAGDDWPNWLAAQYDYYLQRVAVAAGGEDYRQLFRLFGRFRVLCALRRGQRGADGMNEWIERYLARQGHGCSGRTWYPGRPVMVARNDYFLGLYNGDIGLCLPDPERNGELAVWFEQPGAQLRSYVPVQLPACETAWALTIHKSQGSEFDEVFIVLPEARQQILCRELLYTAVTRARKKVSILADREAIRTAVTKRTIRFGGLAERLTASQKSTRSAPGDS